MTVLATWTRDRSSKQTPDDESDDEQLNTYIECFIVTRILIMYRRPGM